jgi:Thiol-disulfide isomerase and thioredoxins
MKRQNLNYLVLILGLLIFFSDAQAQLLKGIIKADSIADMQVAYTLNGDLLNLQYKDITPAEDGSFSFNTDLPTQYNDLCIYIGNEIFGVHVEKGKTTTVLLKKKKGDNTFEIKFKGDNVELSYLYNTYAQGFDIMKYFSMDPTESKTPQEYRNILDSEYRKLKKQIAAIKDSNWKNYYTKLSEGMYTWTKIRIIMDQAHDEKKAFKDYPEYNEMIQRIDPNDSINIKNNLIYAWLGGISKLRFNQDEDDTNLYIDQMNIVEKYITNTEVKQSLIRYIPHVYFSYGNANGDVNKFWSHYKEFAKGYPELLAQYELKVKSITSTKQGNEIPYNPTLTKRDGTTCKLSDLVGSFVYIDIWATWCGPCCKEIPYLEKVAEHFKGNDKIKIISISVDKNRNAWLKKLDKDQPTWAQYILTSEEEKKFMSAWGISGIPRFIMLNKEGKIFSADALRPSSEALVTTIESQL